MADNSSNTFSCPHCGKQHIWKSALAGRKVKCSCGSTLRMTQNPGESAILITPASPLANEDNKLPDAGTAKKQEFENRVNSPGNEAGSMDMNPYDLEIPDEDFQPKSSPDSGKQKPDKRCPQCHQPIADQAAICIHCGYDFKQSKQLKTKKSQSKSSATDQKPGDASSGSSADKKPLPEEPAYVSAVVAAARRNEDRKKWAEQEAKAYSRKVNFVWPVTMLIVGPLIIIVAAFAIQAISGQPGIEALVALAGLEILIMTPLLIVALYIAAALLKLDFGEIKTAVFKAIAINTGPGALADILSIPLVVLALMGFWIMMALPLILYMIFMGIPLGKMFDLDFQENLWTILIIATLRLIAFLLIYMQVYNVLFSAHS